MYHENDNKQMDTYAFDLQEIQRVRQYICVLTLFHSLIIADDIVIYLTFAIINDNLLK